MSTPDPSHYSYQHYANTDVAESFDALRFSGGIGQILLEAQEAILVDALQPAPGRTIADIGTGTGRAALALARTGAQVIGIDASEEMLAVARRRAAETNAGGNLRFERGDAHALPLEACSVDAAVCLRVLMHTPDWRVCLAELCRISRSRIVFDYPSATSAAAVQSGARRVGHALGMKTEPYRVMRAAEVRDELARHGWHARAEHRQFVMPIAFHKAVGSARFTRGVERALASAGLLRLFGSPVTVVAEPEEPRSGVGHRGPTSDEARRGAGGPAA